MGQLVFPCGRIRNWLIGKAIGVGDLPKGLCQPWDLTRSIGHMAQPGAEVPPHSRGSPLYVMSVPRLKASNCADCQKLYFIRR